MCGRLAVFVGRCVLSLWVEGTRVHELYTAACGVYACWLSIRAVSILSHWLPQGWRAILTRIQEWLVLVSAR